MTRLGSFQGALADANDDGHGIDKQAADVKRAMEKMNNGGDREDEEQRIAPHHGRRGDEKKNRGDDFAAAEHGKASGERPANDWVTR
jgi:hypothetical protein